MKALTLTQPWALLVVLGVKQFETRGWAPLRLPRRSRIAIHAAKGWTADDRAFAEELYARGFLRLTQDALPRGAVLGEVTVLGYRPTEMAIAEGAITLTEALLGDYSEGRWAWRLADPVAYPEPIPARGMLGLWEWER